jgi:UDP-N-acetylmuramoyl-tripeptide--D-alanyl-D-alanine ligase
VFAVADLIPAVSGRVVFGNPAVGFDNFCIDSRFVGPNTVFVPLMGQSRDGHQFVIDAINKGAVCAIVRSGHHQIHEIIHWLQERTPRGREPQVCIIEVRHTLVALQKLAEWFRIQHSTNVIGITGSVGKTGTKEILIQLLSTKYPTVGTEKNFNNEIGVPLALSKITPKTRVAVVEMAMRARGEISLLSRIAHPSLTLITNTSGSHVGRLGSFNEVYKAKCEIADGMETGGTIILNRNDPNLPAMHEEIKARKPSTELTFKYFDAAGAFNNCGLPPFISPGMETSEMGELPEADVWVENVQHLGLSGSEFDICNREQKVRLHLPLLGRGAIENLTAAAATALEQGMTLEEIAGTAPELLPAPQRLNLFELRDDLYLIDDCYNSSPASVRDSLELLNSVDRNYRKMLVVGDMLELGKYETLLHRQLAQTALSMPLDAVFAVGPRMNAMNEVEADEDIELFYIEGRSDIEYEPPVEESRFGGGDPRQWRGSGAVEILDDRAAGKLSALILNMISQDDRPTVVLIKGSRSLHLERVVNELLDGTGN